VGKLSTERRDRLRLVARNTTSELPLILTDRADRKEFERLTEALIDALIEMVDLIDGEPDAEPADDELEDSDHI
jgi:hypothetical protein